MKLIIIILFCNIGTFRLNLMAVQDMELKTDQVKNILIYFIYKLFFMRENYDAKIIYENYYEKILKENKKTYIEQTQLIITENINRIFNNKVPNKFSNTFISSIKKFLLENKCIIHEGNIHIATKLAKILNENMNIENVIIHFLVNYANLLLDLIIEDIYNIIYFIEFISSISVGSYTNLYDKNLNHYIYTEYSNGEFIKDNKKHSILHNYDNKTSMNQTNNIVSDDYVIYFYFSLIDEYCIHFFFTPNFVYNEQPDGAISKNSNGLYILNSLIQICNQSRSKFIEEIKKKLIIQFNENCKEITFFVDEQTARHNLIIKSTIFNFIGKDEQIKTLLLNYLMNEIEKSKKEIIDLIQQSNENKKKYRISIYKTNK